MQLLAYPHASVNQIAKIHRVSTHTVRAIREREAVAIAGRKQRLISIFGNVAEMAAERMEQLCGKASLRDAGTTAGIATDKLLALLGETGADVPVSIAIQVNAQALQDKYQDLVRKVEAQGTGEQGAESRDSLANCETFSEAPGAMDLRSGKELPKSEEASPSA